jgi:hypothetical protein
MKFVTNCDRQLLSQKHCLKIIVLLSASWYRCGHCNYIRTDAVTSVSVKVYRSLGCDAVYFADQYSGFGAILCLRVEGSLLKM